MPGNFYTVSLEEIAAWPAPNYTDPEARTWLPGFAIAWQVLATAFVTGRLYLRLRNKSGAFGLDDTLIIVAFAFSIAFTATACIAVWEYGIGRHVWDMRPEHYEGSLYYAWVAQLMFVFTSGATKVSVLLFYRRMAKNTYSMKWMYCVWVLLFITCGSWLAFFIVYCTICSPLSTYWEIHKMMAIGDGRFTCLNGSAVTISAGILTIASDFWTAALPCAMFHAHDLGVSQRQKAALNVIFCLGFLVTGVGIARTYYLWQMGQNQDLSWIGYDLFVTCVVECQLSIILCCAPFLRALFRRYFPNLTHTNTTRTDTNDTENMRSARRSLRWSEMRGNTFRPTPPVFLRREEPDVDLVTREEKKGYLVLENSSGRLIWNDRSSHAQSTSTG